MPDISPIIFLHLFKCGGTSVIDRMARVVGKDRVYHARGGDGVRKDFADKASPAHTAYVVAGHMPLALVREHFAGAPIFTVLRDPVDRMVSQYLHFRREGLALADANKGGQKDQNAAHLYRCGFCAQNDFEAFIDARDRRLQLFTRNYMSRRIAGLRARENSDDTAALLAAAQTNLDQFAAVLTTDHIDTDFDEIFKDLVARHFERSIGHKFVWPSRKKRNVASNRKASAIAVSPDAMLRLVENNRADFALYGASRWLTA